MQTHLTLSFLPARHPTFYKARNFSLFFFSSSGRSLLLPLAGGRSPHPVWWRSRSSPSRALAGSSRVTSTPRSSSPAQSVAGPRSGSTSAGWRVGAGRRRRNRPKPVFGPHTLRALDGSRLKVPGRPGCSGIKPETVWPLGNILLCNLVRVTLILGLLWSPSLQLQWPREQGAREPVLRSSSSSITHCWMVQENTSEVVNCGKKLMQRKKKCCAK